MKQFDKKELSEMTRFYRANLINCLTGTKPALLLGSISSDGTTNLAMFSSVVHLGADPSLVAFVQRPLTATSHSYRNIIERGIYTFNHVPAGMVTDAHHTSAKFNDGVSEFNACGFEEEYVDGFAAPFVKKSPIRWGMRFIREVHFPENDTRLMIGEVMNVFVDEAVMLPDGNLDLQAAQSVAAGGLETYYSVKLLDKLAYAKPDNRPVSIL
jgi:flavin reductase (DIM6/NTAB) family NADH-FMN oxidoreductase RutF